jgi:hypothetical protein
MPRIHVSYGPPGPQGVTTLLGLGADEVSALQDKTDKTLSMAGWISVGAWLVGTITNKKRLRDIGIGGALVSFGTRYVGR